jgi:hypothetical protein
VDKLGMFQAFESDRMVVNDGDDEHSMRKTDYSRHDDKAQDLPVEGRQHLDVLLTWQLIGGHFRIVG